MLPRIIPTLLIKEGYLYKTRKFSNPVYIGDPVNAVKIFNEKEADEICLLDIGAARTGTDPNLVEIKDIASECFTPLSYGGGVKSVEIVGELLNIGIEKIIINTEAYKKPDLIRNLSEKFGVSTIVGSIDVVKKWNRSYRVMIGGGSEAIPYDPIEWAIELERRGVGEIIINSIDRDGEMNGYDLDLVKAVATSVGVPVIASGGAGSMVDFVEARRCGASAVAAGSMFVFSGRHRAVLITYPTESEINSLWN